MARVAGPRSLTNVNRDVNRYLDESPQRPALSVLFVGFILFMSIVLVNLFIGVVTDLYPTAKRNSEQVRAAAIALLRGACVRGP